MPPSFVAVAGATGQLGKAVATNLRARNVSVKALVRPNTDPSRTADLRAADITVAEIDMDDVSALTQELQGVTTVVSTLNGLAGVILGTQQTLLDAAVAAKVKRFIPSDFALDFTKCTPGSNRNLDLRRQFHTKLDQSGLAWTSILNGGFMDMLSGDMPIVNEKFKRVLYWNNREQPLDFTTIADTAAFTAAVAADAEPTPKYLRIAGHTVTPVELAEVVSRVKGGVYSPLWVGSTGFLGGVAGFMRRFELGGKESDVFPAWQGMQYVVNMFSGDGKLDPLDNTRYPDLKWTQIDEILSGGKS